MVQKFYQNQVAPLVLSKACEERLSQYHSVWAYEIIAMHQTLDSFQKHRYQYWEFVKQNDEILIFCYGLHDEVLCGMHTRIGIHQDDFSNIALYIYENRCMLVEEVIQEENLTVQSMVESYRKSKQSQV